MEIIESGTSQEGCIFCQIVAGSVPSRKIYEDDDVVAVMDINPANPGHLLVLPKSHYAIMPQVPDYTVSRLAAVTKLLSNHIFRALGAKGTTIFIANGPQAGQKAPHFMIHLIPRADGDNLPLVLPMREMKDEEMEAIKSKIEPALKSKSEPGVIDLDKKPEIIISDKQVEAEEEKDVEIKKEKETSEEEIEEAKPIDEKKPEKKEETEESKQSSEEEKAPDEKTVAEPETDETEDEKKDDIKEKESNDKDIDFDLISRFLGGS